MARVIAIIPARGGSKGIPGKNLRPFLGVPLVARAVQAALGASHVDHVLVTSDDPAILAVARQYGADTVTRPEDISGDTASSESALLHALESSPACADAEVLVFLQCTSPLTTSGEIDAVIAALDERQADVTLAVVEVHVFLWEIDEDGVGVGVNHDASKARQRRQDRPRQYRETGAIYAMRVPGFKQAGRRFFGKVSPVHLPHAVEADIDTLKDWQMLEVYAQTRDA